MTRLSIGTIFFSAVILLVTTHVNAGLDEDLVFYLDFDNVKKQTIVDTSGNGLDAEIIENTEIVKGKYGDAIHITNNGQDCVNIPSQEKLKVRRRDNNDGMGLLSRNVERQEGTLD